MRLAKLVGQFGDAAIRQGLELLEIASVQIACSALRCTVIFVLKEVLESDPSKPVITMLILRITGLLLRNHFFRLAAVTIFALASH